MLQYRNDGDSNLPYLRDDPYPAACRGLSDQGTDPKRGGPFRQPGAGRHDRNRWRASGNGHPRPARAGWRRQTGLHPVPDESGMLDVGAIAFKVPGKFQVQQPKSSMRRAQLSAPGSAGPAELIVFFFGPQGAGTTKDNIDRWVGQFSNPMVLPVSDAKQTSSKVSGFDVTKLDVAGQFAGGMKAAGPARGPPSGSAHARGDRRHQRRPLLHQVYRTERDGGGTQRCV